MKALTKIYLIVLAAFIIFNIAFVSSRSYSFKFSMSNTVNDKVQKAPFSLTNITHDQYITILRGPAYSNFFEFFATKEFIINQTKVNYLFGLPAYTIYVIYGGYFIFTVLFILSILPNILIKFHKDKEKDKLHFT